jgi:hypothetical protein
MNKIQIKSNEKVQRKRRTRAVAIPQLAASKISHKDTDYAGLGWPTDHRATVAGRPQQKLSAARRKSEL